MDAQIVLQEGPPWWAAYVDPWVPHVAAYVMGAIIGFTMTQRVKRLARPQLHPITVEAIGGGATAIFTYLFAAVVFRLNHDVAIVHGAANAVVYVVVVAFLMSLARRFFPDFYERVRTTPRQAGDPPPPGIGPEDPTDPTRVL